MDTPLLKYLERHQKKMRFILLIYIGVLLIKKIIFGPIMIDAFIKTNHLNSAVLVVLSLLTLICGFYGFIKLNRYCCIYFLTFYSIEKFTRTTHEFLMMHQNYQLFSPNTLKNYLVDVYFGLILSIVILLLGTLLLYVDYFKERQSRIKNNKTSI